MLVHRTHIEHWLVILLGICSLTKTKSQDTLLKVLPLTWTDTGVNLQLHNNNSVTAIYFQASNPCANSEYSASSQFSPETRTWCQQQFSMVVVKGLEDLCRPGYASHSYSQGPIRTKRAAAGDYDDLLRRIDATNNNIASLDDKINRNGQSTSNLQNVLNRLQSTVQNQEADISELRTSTNELRTWRSQVDKTLAGPYSRHLSELVTFFSNFRRDLQALKTTWENGSPISSQLLALFDPTSTNMQNHGLLSNQLATALPNRCYTKSDEGLVYFEFNHTAQVPPSDFRLLEASPFTFYQLQSPGQSSIGYTLEYVGPKHVIYDSVSECVLPYNDYVPGRRALNLIPMYNISEPGSCAHFRHPNALQKYWRKTCNPTMYFLDVSSIQVQPLDDLYYYVYCHGFSITLYKKLVSCPNYVFSIHRDEFVEIQVVEPAGGTTMKLMSFLSPVAQGQSGDLLTTTKLSNKISNLLIPDLESLDFETVPASTVCSSSGDDMKGDGSGSAVKVGSGSLVSAGTGAGGTAGAGGSGMSSSSTASGIYIGIAVVGVLIIIFGLIIVYYVRKRALSDKTGGNGRGGVHGGNEQRPMMALKERQSRPESYEGEL